MELLRQRRLVRLFFVLGLCFLGLVGHLWLLQGKEGNRYARLALEQVTRWVALEDTPRGKILDRNLLPIQGERVEERVVVFPSAIGDREEVARSLSEILALKFSEGRRILEGDACFLPYPLRPEQADAVREKGWTGVLVLPVHFRYGERPLASQTIGHLGKISSTDELLALERQGKKTYHYNDQVGKTGLEKYFEQELKGTVPQRAVRVFSDATGRLLGGPFFQVEEQAPDRERHDLVLTLDSRIQGAVEEIMDRRVAKGAVVVMEAGTGDLLALASRPAYDPAHPEQYLGAGMKESFFNRCTALYQPGSIFKLVLASAALEEGIVFSDSPFSCQGENESLIRCWKAEGHGEISFSRAFAESCNPAFARIGMKLGASKLIEYAGRFGLGNQTIIGYPAAIDARQDLQLIASPNSLVNSSVGQGPVLVTPVQAASMVNTIVSDGLYREPRLVKEIRKSDSGLVVSEFSQGQAVRAISATTAGKLRALLELAVDEGTGIEAAEPVFGSAGKTGSAQSANGKVNAWFTGYAPRSNPRYIVTVLIEEGISGSESAAPVFREIVEQIHSFNDNI